MVTQADYKGISIAWCPGCGNFGILNAVKRALVQLELEPHQVLMVSGIGQAGKLPHYGRGNILNTLHGRTLPTAIGAKVANPGLVVLAIGGDGDGYAEGGNHFLHAARRNHDITYLVHDNQIYGLTKGQASPTSDAGFVTKTTPEGASRGLNALPLAITIGATFVARAFAGDMEVLADVISRGIQHKGFSLIDILQPCVTFNHKNTWRWYRDRVYRLEEERGYDPGDRKAAMQKAEEWGDRIPTGVIYETQAPTYEVQQPGLQMGTLVKQEINPKRVDKLLDEVDVTRMVSSA